MSLEIICVKCKGTGKIKGKFFSRKCILCSGTGRKRAATYKIREKERLKKNKPTKMFVH